MGILALQGISVNQFFLNLKKFLMVRNKLMSQDAIVSGNGIFPETILASKC